MDESLEMSEKKILKILELNENKNRIFKNLQNAMKEVQVRKII